MHIQALYDLACTITNDWEVKWEDIQERSTSLLI